MEKFRVIIVEDVPLELKERRVSLETKYQRRRLSERLKAKLPTGN